MTSFAIRFLLCHLLLGQVLFAQEIKGFKIPDSLADKSYDDLHERYYSQINVNNNKAKIYAQTYLQKGKNDKRPIKTARGYRFMAAVSYEEEKNYKNSLLYIDSAIAVSKDIPHKTYPAILYVNKGATYESLGDFKKALDNYLEALHFSQKSENEHFTFITKHNIGLLKKKLGKYEEAKTIFKECLSYEKRKEKMNTLDSLSYFITLSELVDAYRLNQQIDSAYLTNQRGIKHSTQKELHPLFILNKGIIQYYREEYNEAIENINSILPELSASDDKYYLEKTHLINAHLFLGKTFEALSNKALAVSHYVKIDSILQTSNYIVPETRIAYESLISYYKSLNNKSKQLFYIEKLLYADSILDNNYKYVSNKLNKGYDTPQLLLEKDKLIEAIQLEKESTLKRNTIISIFIITMVFILLIFNYRKQKKYKKRFEELFHTKVSGQKEEKTKASGTSYSVLPVDIAENVINAILKKLDEFEQKNGFLKPNITINSLAGTFNANSKYLSNIIHVYKKKRFVGYINDLRIAYIVERLKHNAKLRTYTIQAIGEEAGFNNADSFSRAFRKKTGIYPSYFITQLKKQKETGA